MGEESTTTRKTGAFSVEQEEFLLIKYAFMSILEKQRYQTRRTLPNILEEELTKIFWLRLKSYMPTLSSLTPEGIFRALFVGAKHSGKTVAACSWLSPDSGKRMKVLDGDGRIRGALGASWIQKDRIDYDYFAPRLPGQNQKTFFERVNENLEAFLIDSMSGRSMYETYLSDSLTAFTKNLVLDAIPLTHVDNKGKKLGALNMAGPEDYGFESTGVDQYLSFLRSLPMNVIVTAHVIPKYDKPMVTDARGRSFKDTYAESVVVGEKLSIRDKIGANCTIYFDHIFKFSRRIVGGYEKFFVEFIGDIACTSFPNLEPGEHDITGKDFRKFVLDKVSGKTTA